MPVEPPPKKEQLQKLLERGNVFLHLDPRVEGVVVPTWHAQKPQLVLQLGLHFAVPIPDLKIDDRGVRCTLSFNRSPFFCDLPWTAVYAMVAEDGQVTVWPTELPPELVPQPAPVRRAPPTSRSARGRSTDAAESTTSDGSDASTPAAPQRPRIAAVPSTRSQRLAPVTPIKPAPAPAPAEESEPPTDDPSPTTPGDRKGGRERPAWLRVVK
jgi:stringent starvation protein B